MDDTDVPGLLEMLKAAAHDDQMERLRTGQAFLPVLAEICENEYLDQSSNLKETIMMAALAKLLSLRMPLSDSLKEEIKQVAQALVPTWLTPADIIRCLKDAKQLPGVLETAIDDPKSNGPVSYTHLTLPTTPYV